MIFNGYTALAVFLSLLRVTLSIALVAAAVPAWRALSQHETDAVEHRVSLLVSLVIAVVVLNLISWPLLYVLLQSYVQQWPSVMCIYGVTQIGRGTTGLSQLLPVLLDILQILRPLLLFVSGTAAIVYLLNRQTATSALIRRVLCLLIATGALTTLDAGAELAYVAIPRTEVRITGGCCTSPLEALERSDRLKPDSMISPSQQAAVFWSYYTLNVALIAGLFALSFRKSVLPAGPNVSRFIDRALGFATVLTLPVGYLFLHDVAAPGILGLPFHQCPYDLVSDAPESLIGVAASLLGTFSIWWSILVPRVADCDQTRKLMPEIIIRCRFVALTSYAASLSLISMELLIA